MHYLLFTTAAPTLQESIFSAKLNVPFSLSAPLCVSFRDRALFARLAFLHDHGGQFFDGGWAATDARGGRSVPQLAGPG